MVTKMFVFKFPPLNLDLITKQFWVQCSVCPVVAVMTKVIVSLLLCQEEITHSETARRDCTLHIFIRTKTKRYETWHVHMVRKNIKLSKCPLLLIIVDIQTLLVFDLAESVLQSQYSSASCERSFSALKLITTHLRSIMTDESDQLKLKT